MDFSATISVKDIKSAAADSTVPSPASTVLTPNPMLARRVETAPSEEAVEDRRAASASTVPAPNPMLARRMETAPSEEAVLARRMETAPSEEAVEDRRAASASTVPAPNPMLARRMETAPSEEAVEDWRAASDSTVPPLRFSTEYRETSPALKADTDDRWVTNPPTWPTSGSKASREYLELDISLPSYSMFF